MACLHSESTTMDFPTAFPAWLADYLANWARAS